MTETATATVAKNTAPKAKATKPAPVKTVAPAEIDLNAMSAKQLETIIADATTLLRDVKTREASEMKTRIAELLTEGGFTMDELFGAVRGRHFKRRSPRDTHELAPKFRNPENPSQTWTGLGRRPKWLQEAIANGEDLNSFRI